jgi:mannitol-1-phosphate 5-dehydrogenase
MGGVAVHFGAGNIGRGFVGLILHRGGYEVIFADVVDTLVDALNHTPTYHVIEVGLDSTEECVRGYRAINCLRDNRAVVAAIADADIVTTAVGSTSLELVAPAISAGLRARRGGAPPLMVMACENAINATDLLVNELRDLVSEPEWTTLLAKGVFANTAVDRIVPTQRPGDGLDVTVETYAPGRPPRSSTLLAPSMPPPGRQRP